MHSNICYSIIHSTSCENYNDLYIYVLLSQDESSYTKYQQPLCKKISHYPQSKIDRHENITIFTPTKLTVNNDSVDSHRRSWHGPTSLCSNFLFTNLFSIQFLISLLFHLFFLILTCLCQYSYNLMLTTIYMFRPYIIDTNSI